MVESGENKTKQNTENRKPRNRHQSGDIQMYGMGEGGQKV